MPAKIHDLLGSANLVDTTPTTVYTVPAARKATVSINVVNDHTLANTFSVSIGSAVIESATALAAAAVLERAGITVGAGRTISVTRAASGGAVRVAVWGIEEDV
jgi:Na+/H+ antiporter NhaD/arsenite permease-like protein